MERGTTSTLSSLLLLARHPLATFSFALPIPLVVLFRASSRSLVLTCHSVTQRQLFPVRRFLLAHGTRGVHACVGPSTKVWLVRRELEQFRKSDSMDADCAQDAGAPEKLNSAKSKAAKSDASDLDRTAMDVEETSSKDGVDGKKPAPQKKSKRTCHH